METLKAICSSVSIPVVAIGGIKEENILSLKGTGVAGAAIVSGIFARKNIREACVGCGVWQRKWWRDEKDGYRGGYF